MRKSREKKSILPVREISPKGLIAITVRPVREAVRLSMEPAIVPECKPDDRDLGDAPSAEPVKSFSRNADVGRET